MSMWLHLGFFHGGRLLQRGPFRRPTRVTVSMHSLSLMRIAGPRPPIFVECDRQKRRSYRQTEHPAGRFGDERGGPGVRASGAGAERAELREHSSKCAKFLKKPFSTVDAWDQRIGSPQYLRVPPTFARNGFQRTHLSHPFPNVLPTAYYGRISTRSGSIGPRSTSTALGWCAATGGKAAMVRVWALVPCRPQLCRCCRTASRVDARTVVRKSRER